MMHVVAIGVVGICLGVIAAGSRAPLVRWVPTASALLLVVVTAVIATLQQGGNPLVGGLVLVVCFQIGSMLYAGAIWKREALEPGISYWGWVWRDLSHPAYLRNLYRERTQTGKDTSLSVDDSYELSSAN